MIKILKDFNEKFKNKRIEEKQIIIDIADKLIIEEIQNIFSEELGEFSKNIDKYLDIHNVKDIFCPDCKISKMKCKSHNKRTPKAKEILEVINSDIIGPINDSITGTKFIITFIVSN